MPTLETGLFIILNLVAFGFMFLGFRNYGILHVIPMVLFFAMSLLMFSEYDIVTTSTISDGTTTWTQQSYLIDDTDVGTYWLGWIYFLVGIGTFFFFLKDMWPSK